MEKKKGTTMSGLEWDCPTSQIVGLHRAPAKLARAQFGSIIVLDVFRVRPSHFALRCSLRRALGRACAGPCAPNFDKLDTY